jgi:hypothetical protein
MDVLHYTLYKVQLFPCKPICQRPIFEPSGGLIDLFAQVLAIAYA